MKGYVIANIEVRDAEGYEAYRSRTADVIARYGGRFLVRGGKVEVREGDEVIATRGAGDYIGEIALLDNRPRTATVVATTPVTLEVIGRREFKTLLNDVPEINEQVLATMAQRLAEHDERASS